MNLIRKTAATFLLVAASVAACIAQDDKVQIFYPKAQKIENIKAQSVKDELLRLLKLRSWGSVDNGTDKIYKSCESIEISDDSVWLVTKKATVALLRADCETVLCVERKNWYYNFVRTLTEPRWTIYLPAGRIQFLRETAFDLCNLLFTIQSQLNARYFENQLEKFKPMAEQYRQANPKPVLSESIRKFIVPANAESQNKNYKRAIELYQKAISIDPVAYPAAYYNLALLSEQFRFYGTAIFNMKKYLLLVPDATDARAAQDKIYEWESYLTFN